MLERIGEVGFGFDERMSGTYRGLRPGLTDGEIRIDFCVRCDDLPAGILDVVGGMEGTVTMDGVARDAAATGAIAISPLWKRRIRYTFSFAGDDGLRYEFDGQKTLRPFAPLRSWTTLEGKVREDGSGDVVADAVLRFHLRREIVPFLLSFRPIRREWTAA
jgi:hypothetical protein